MKKVFTIIGITALIAVVMVSCKNQVATVQASKYDTTGLAAFQNWKMQQYQEAMYGNVAPVTATTSVKSTPARKAVTHKTSSSNYSSGSMNSSSTHTAQTVVKKKGWSKAAKYSVIGGAGGAVLGAVINKRNRVAGGVIGGILGGGGGYIFGRSKDKQDGRY